MSLQRFRALHRPGSPFLLPNAWDHASALALVDAGFTAIGTAALTPSKPPSQPACPTRPVRPGSRRSP